METIAFWILEAAGAFVLVAAIVAVYVLLVDGFLEWRHKPHYRSWYEGKQDALMRLRDDSFWFSEDVPTMQLIADLGNGMKVDDARDKWRKARGSEGRA